MDILCLTETWHSNKNDLLNKNKFLCPSGYNFFEKARKKRNKKAKRNSGGIVILYGNIFQHCIISVDTSNENMFWIKINGNKIDKQNDLYITTVNNSPNNSSYSANNKNDIFNQLQNKISTFSATDRLIIRWRF